MEVITPQISWWERTVGLVKRRLRKILVKVQTMRGKLTPSLIVSKFPEFTTPDHGGNMTALTPAHFLNGEKLIITMVKLPVTQS